MESALPFLYNSKAPNNIAFSSSSNKLLLFSITISILSVFNLFSFSDSFS